LQRMRMIGSPVRRGFGVITRSCYLDLMTG
jgi:hypothetical protein